MNRCAVSLLLGAAVFATAAEPIAYPDHSKLLVVRDAAGKEMPIADEAGWKQRRAHILANMELVMGPLPESKKKVPFDVKVSEEKDMGTYNRIKFTMAVEERDRLPVYLLMPKKREGKLPAVVCLHPTHQILGKGVPVGLGPKADRHYAVHLAERGYVAIVPDYPQMGEYKVDAYALGYQSATMKAIWNHMRVVDYLQSLPEVDGSRIGAIGHSLGGHNSIFLGVFDERIKCVVSNCGFNSFPKYMKGNVTGWSHLGYMPLIKTKYEAKGDKIPWDFTEAIAALAPRAFLASAPVRDNNFEVSGVKDCINAAEPVYKLLKAGDKLQANYPDCAHDFPDEVREVAFKFLDKHLGK
ncbi:alpha/beta hydrolase [Zavarzinella formosa]|uniref:alpha/beta hydrolase n=1 Tax=Zavarzinella formosa TaxID=360055 RepID=UPI0002E4DF1B|nr:dienelactone hydrolase family protein [Zavarzinella formosa]